MITGANAIPQASNLRWGFDLHNWKRCYKGAQGTNKMPTTWSGAYNSLYSARSSNDANLRVQTIRTATPFTEYLESGATYVRWNPSAQINYYSGANEATGLCRTSAVTVPDPTLSQSYGVWVYVYDEEWSRYDYSVHMYVTGGRGLGKFSDSGQRRKDRTGREWRHYHNTGASSSTGGQVTQYHAFHLKNSISTPLRVLYTGPTYFDNNETPGYCPVWGDGVSRGHDESSYNIADGSMPGNAHYNMSYTADGLMKFNGASKINTYNLGSMVDTTLCSTFTREFTGTSGAFLLYRETNGTYTSNEDGHGLIVYGSGVCATGIEFEQTGNDHSVSGGVSYLNQPCCLVSTYDHYNKVLKLYVDGVLVNYKSTAGETHNPYGGVIGYTMGCQSGTNHGGTAADRSFFTGTIHNSYIHDVALTDTEVATMSDMCLRNVP